jgi:hypothetical protein
MVIHIASIAQEHGVKLLRSHDVMHIAPAASQEAPIFSAAKRRPDPIFRNCSLPTLPTGLQPVIFIEGALQRYGS